MSAAARVQATKLWFQSIVIGKKLCPFAPPLLQNKDKDTSPNSFKFPTSTTTFNTTLCPNKKLSSEYSSITEKKFPKLRIHASNALTHKSLINEITNEAQLLINGNTTNIIMGCTPNDINSMTQSDENDEKYQECYAKPETTLVVLHPSLCQSFREFVQLSWEIQSQAILQSGFVHDLQIVLFHPLATHNTYMGNPEHKVCGDKEKVNEMLYELTCADAADYTIRSPYPTVHLLREVDVMQAMTGGYIDIEGIPARNKATLRKDGVRICADRLLACKVES